MRSFLFATLAAAVVAQAQAQAPVRLAIAGLNHGHVAAFLTGAVRRTGDVRIVGVYDPDAALLAKYGKANQLADSVLFTDLARMLDAVKPGAVSIFSDTYSHAGIVEAVAPRRIPVMMEKPLAVDMKQANAIQAAASRYQIPVIVNYETTWYPSHAEIWNLVHERKAAGEIRKMVAMDGHQGPQEIHTPPEFFAWLIDPAKNGAGALYDFGCYGANLMTWLMDNQRPLKVTAIAQTEKLAIYAPVDDEATILVEYPKAQGIIQASWNWPFNRKDFEVYGQTGYAIATGGDSLRVRLPGRPAEETPALSPRPPEERDALSYLIAVVRGQLKPSGLSSLENNVVVTEILEAAREAVRTGRTVTLR
ncbi:MAG: Gfo/Idh/MocA family oxidoreductase [Bryobacteraceae bacterium]|jgi:predicted dehydrogenase